MEVSFNTTSEDRATIAEITDRVMSVAPATDRLTINMDITACHANGCPLRLKDLLEADDFNFVHDVFGIHRHIDRETGQLGGFFRPRFAE